MNSSMLDICAVHQYARLYKLTATLQEKLERNRLRCKLSMRFLRSVRSNHSCSGPLLIIIIIIIMIPNNPDGPKPWSMISPTSHA